MVWCFLSNSIFSLCVNSSKTYYSYAILNNVSIYFDSWLFCYHGFSAVLVGCSYVDGFIVNLSPFKTFVSTSPQNLNTRQSSHICGPVFFIQFSTTPVILQYKLTCHILTLFLLPSLKAL